MTTPTPRRAPRAEPAGPPAGSGGALTQLEEARIAERIARAQALVEALDRRPGPALARVVDGPPAEEPQGERAPPHAAVRRAAAMQRLRMEDDQIARFDGPGDDVPRGAVPFDVGQPRQARVRVQGCGVVARLERRAVVEHALVRAAHELKGIRRA